MSQIGLKTAGFYIGWRKPFGLLGPMGVFVIVNGDVTALPEQFIHDASADSLTAAGDQGAFVNEFFHDVIVEGL